MIKVTSLNKKKTAEQLNNSKTYGSSQLRLLERYRVGNISSKPSQQSRVYSSPSISSPNYSVLTALKDHDKENSIKISTKISPYSSSEFRNSKKSEIKTNGFSKFDNNSRFN